MYLSKTFSDQENFLRFSRSFDFSLFSEWWKIQNLFCLPLEILEKKWCSHTIELTVSPPARDNLIQVSKMYVLITGGYGFIGSNFVQYFIQQQQQQQQQGRCQITVLDKLCYSGNLVNLEAYSDHFEFIQGDICDRKLLQDLFTRYQFNYVIHFAAESHVDRSITEPAPFIHTNIIGTFNLLEVARDTWSSSLQKQQNRFIHISTDEVYGSLGSTGSFQETSPYHPRSPYSASKASSDHLCNSYFLTFGLPVIILHFSNAYGPYQHAEKLIPLMIHFAKHQQPLPVYGTGQNVRQWVYVTDLCEAISLVLDQGCIGSTYNAGGSYEGSNLEVVQSICDLLDLKLSRQNRRSLIKFVTDRPGHDFRYALDNSKITSELGWRPKTDFVTGLQQTIDWYLSNQAWVQAIVNDKYNFFDYEHVQNSENKTCATSSSILEAPPSSSSSSSIQSSLSSSPQIQISLQHLSANESVHHSPTPIHTCTDAHRHLPKVVMTSTRPDPSAPKPHSTGIGQVLSHKVNNLSPNEKAQALNYILEDVLSNTQYKQLESFLESKFTQPS